MHRTEGKLIQGRGMRERREAVGNSTGDTGTQEKSERVGEAVIDKNRDLRCKGVVDINWR